MKLDLLETLSITDYSQTLTSEKGCITFSIDSSISIKEVQSLEFTGFYSWSNISMAQNYTHAKY